MIQTLKKYNRVIWLCCLGCLGLVSIAFGQTATYQIERTLSVKQAYKFTNELGIKANASGGKVEVRMYAKNYYTSGRRGDIHSMLYGAYTNNNSTSSYYATDWDITYTTCNTAVLPTKYCENDGNYLTFPEKSTKYEDRIQVVAHKLSGSEEVVSDPNSKYRGKTFQVIIELEVNGSTTLDNVYNIKLPGVADIAGLEFDSNVKNYSNPCPSTIGCDAVADFKNISDAANKKPIVVAHRGFHGMRNGPENSSSAVEKAYNDRFRYIEVDLRMTKDYVPILFHDDYLGYVTDFATLNNTNTSTHTEELTWSQISTLKYRDRYWDQTYKTAVNDAGTTVQARVGNATNVGMTKFETIADYIKGKDIMVYLDIKSTPTVRNFEVMKQCILIGAKKGILHQIAFKMVRTNLTAGHPKELLMTLASAKQYLGNVYTTFKNDLNIHVVDYAPGNGSDFINHWIGEGNVVGFEFDIQNNPLFEVASLKNNNVAGYNNKSPWEYTKSRGYRTGIWSSTALDPRGRPGHDPSSWSTSGVMVKDLTTWQYYTDNRARMEVLSLVSPQYITHDRPDEVYNYLNAVSKINANTKR